MASLLAGVGQLSQLAKLWCQQLMFRVHQVTPMKPQTSLTTVTTVTHCSALQ